MSLISCPECGNQISTLAAACPKCGAPVKKQAGIPLDAPTVAATGLTSKALRKQQLWAALLIIAATVAAIAIAHGPNSYSDRFWGVFWLFALGLGVIWMVVIRVRVWWRHR
jgi:uncharacterized membrane protein YvbJ